MLSRVEHEKSFTTSGPDLGPNCLPMLSAHREKVNEKMRCSLICILKK